MTEPAVLVARRNHAMIITINRPQSRNAVDVSVHRGVGGALAEADADAAIRVVVITGAGDQSFCAGADLKALACGEKIVPDDPVELGWGFAGYVRHHISKPTIAAVNGLALGGGTEIVLASDLAIAVEGAKFGLPEVKRGIIAGAGGAFRIGRQLPRKVAMEMLLTGDPISAEAALEWGLINRVVPVGDLLEAALELAGRIADNAPLAVQASKRIALSIVDGKIDDEKESWALSRREGTEVMRSADAKEGPRAFAEKRSPLWLAR